MEIFAIDHGNGHVKGLSRKRQIVAPSEVAQKSALGLDDYSGSPAEGLRLYESDEAKGEVYAWGEQLREHVHHSKTLATFTREDRYLGKYYRLLCQFILAELASDFDKEHLDVAVITGCPSSEHGTGEEEALRTAFQKTHVVKRNGKEIIIRVHEVRIVPQPIGTVMSQYMNEMIRVNDKSYETDYVGIIDVGSGTADLDGVNKLKRQTDDTLTIPRGVHDVYRRIADAVNRRKPSAYASIESVERQLPLLLAEGKYQISKASIIPLDNEVQEIITEEFNALKTAIKQRWTNLTKFDRILVTGGGAAFFKEEFRDWNKNMIIVKDSQTANVEGYYRFAKYIKLGEKVG